MIFLHRYNLWAGFGGKTKPHGREVMGLGWGAQAQPALGQRGSTAFGG